MPQLSGRTISLEHHSLKRSISEASNSPTIHTLTNLIDNIEEHVVRVEVVTSHSLARTEDFQVPMLLLHHLLKEAEAPLYNGMLL